MIANRLIINSKLNEMISDVLSSKFSKYIIHILKFIINVSAEKDGCDLLDSINIMDKLQALWSNRHPVIKPLIVQIFVMFIRVNNKNYS